MAMGAPTVEGIQGLKLLPGLLLFFLGVGCSLSPKPSEIAELEENEEFEKVVQVRRLKEPAPPSAEPVRAEKTPAPVRPKKTLTKKQPPVPVKKTVMGKKTEPSPSQQEKSGRLPKIEDDEGFDGRRPEQDPFVVGEVLTYDVSYGVISAGNVQLKTRPFVEVNGRKSYYFSSHVQSNSVFSFFYKVDDWAETYVDYETLVPYSFSLHVRESKQLREVQNYFDWPQLKAQHWEKRLKRGKMREKKLEWEILPYSQNVISAFFYLRAFHYRPGKIMMFRVADEGKNLVTTIKVLKEEEIDTPAGRLATIKSEVNFEYDGVFKPVGSVLLWMTRGPRKHIARIDAKIKIGTLRIELEKIARP